MLLEKRLFLLIDQVHDVVVVAHNEHHLLSEHSQTVLSACQAGELNWHVTHTLRSNLVPILNFLQYLVQRDVEV